jgi:hypothetical protein
MSSDLAATTGSDLAVIPDATVGVTGGNDADTYGWDTAFAINFTHANAAIVKAWPTVSDGAKNLKQAASDDPDFHVDATLGPWQLTMGGDGRNVRLACPIVAGTYTAGSKSIPFANVGCQVVIEVGMQWVPNPDQFSFVLNTGVAAIAKDLDTNTIDDALKAAFATNKRPLSAAATSLVQTAGKEWLVTDGKTYYYLFHSTDKFADEFLSVYEFQTAWANNLKALADAVSAEEPAVAIITIVKNPTSGVAAAVFEELLSIWFNTNIGQFDHVFASLDLSPIVSESDKYAWMKPTATSYAVTDMGTMESSVFGALTMALNHPPSANHQVSPFAIPAGSDAGFLISGPMFLQNMLLAGAREIFNGAAASSFIIENDGLTVRNTTDLVWGRFMMDDKKKGSISAGSYPGQLDAGTLSQGFLNAMGEISVPVTGYTVSVTTKGSQWLLTKGSSEYILNLDGANIDVFDATIVNVAKGDFTMSLVHTYVEIEFIDLLYSYNSDFDVHVNYTEQVQLSLQEHAGKQIFWFDQIQKNMVVSVTKTQAAITRQIVEGAVMAALSLVAVAGPIIEGLSAGAEIGEVTEEGGEAIIDAEAFENAERVNPQAAEDDALLAGEDAASQSGGRLTNIKNAFATPKWKAFGAFTALVGAAVGIDQAVAAIVEAVAKKQWENVPGFDDFANLAITPYTWPNVGGFTLKSAGLAGSLQVGLTVTPS